MSYSFSRRSAERLDSCHDDIIVVMEHAIKIIDFSVLCGYRNEVDQDRVYEEGRSKLQFPASKHNVSPSDAVDVVPYPVDWDDIQRFFQLNGVIQAVAYEHGIELIWGGNWRTFKDYPHYERKI